MTKQRIGWIGLGKMGAPMARNLVAAGFPVTVYNRTAAMVGEALAFGERNGLDWETMIDVVADSPLASPLVSQKTQMLL